MNIVITGASKGIGKAVAEIFAANGHQLFLCARGEVTLYNTVNELQTKYPDAVIKAKPADLSKKEEAIAFANWCLATAIPDIVINNAGFFEPGSVHNEPEGLLESQLAVNLYSAYNVTRTLLPAMMQQKAGHFFTICSIASLHAYANGGAYSVSKFALYGFSKNLREEMKPHGIKVTAVMPGAVLTDSWGNFDNSNKRIMEAADIAQMIYAASQLSPQACVEDIVIRPQLGDL
jgi:short-subunit dehydrogenase